MNEGFANTATAGWSSRNSQRLTYGFVVGMGLFSLSLYLFIFRPVTREVDKLEANLVATRAQIAEIGFGRAESPGAYLDEVQSKIEKMRQLADEVYERTRFRPGLEDLLSAPFRVLEFEQRRFDIQQRLIDLAGDQASSLPVDFLSGLPAYSTTSEDQRLLWLHLEFFNHAVGALLSSGGGLSIEQAESLPVRILGEELEAEGSLLLVQLQLKVEGPATALATFLNGALPENGAAINPVGNNAYSIVRLLIRSDSGSSDGRVTLDARLAGFILSEELF